MKKVMSVLLASVLTLSLAACGGSKPAATQAPATTAAAAETKAPETTAAAAETKAAETAAAAASTDYPTKPLINIVCTSAGGSTDVFARLLGQTLEKYLGQGWVVENHTGGAQIIGTTDLANAEPDGYTCGTCWSASFGMRPYLLEATYTLDDFEFVCGVLHQYSSVIVKADSKWQTLEDLINDLKENPELKYGAGSAGSMQFVWMRYIMDQAGVSATFIPHDGDAGAVTSLQSGAVDFICTETTSAVAGLKSGEFRLLVNCGTERDPSYPDSPCLTELGYECTFSHTMSIGLPAGVPKENVQKLHDAVKEALSDPDLLATAKEAGYNVEFLEPDYILNEIEGLKTVVLDMKEKGVFDNK